MRVVSMSERGARGTCSPPLFVPSIGGACSLRPFSMPWMPAAMQAASAR